jgi:hypothetical protein
MYPHQAQRVNNGGETWNAACFAHAVPVIRIHQPCGVVAPTLSVAKKVCLGVSCVEIPDSVVTIPVALVCSVEIEPALAPWLLAVMAAEAAVSRAGSVAVTCAYVPVAGVAV